jgi:hypothetical protein
MIRLATVIATLAAVPLFAAPASAVEYPYCIINGGMSEGSMSCGYQSLAQCMQTRVGTDMCVLNPRYPGPQQRPRGR